MIDFDVAEANARLEALSPEERLAFAVERFGKGLLFTSSFGAGSGVMLHLWSRVAPHLPVIFLDTGKHFPETLAYRDELAAKLGLNIVNLTPDAGELAKKDATELRWSYDPDGCCEIRKVKPLEKALGGN